jgi:hypothetical protein
MRHDLEDYFIPNKRNNYAPHGLQKAAMIAMGVLVVLSFTIANLHSLIWIGSQYLVSTVLPAVIVDLTNVERAEGALTTLRRNALLDEAARMKAEHMAKHEYFAHYSPDGVSPWFWFGRANYNYVHAGENLAIHFTDSSEVVGAWMNSPTHRANILNGNYSEIGVGTAEGTYEGFTTVYVVQLFGTPAAVAQTQPLVRAESETVAIAANEPRIEEVEVLAESVSITQTVETFEAEPIKVAVIEEKSPIPDTAGDASEVQQTRTASETKDVVITSMEDTPFGVALFSDFISTSTGGIPATIEPEQGQTKEYAPFFMKLATQPHAVLQILYTIIGLFVVGMLLVSIVVEFKRQHPIQIAYGTGLLVAMALLYYVHVVVSQGALIV